MQRNCEFCGKEVHCIDYDAHTGACPAFHSQLDMEFRGVQERSKKAPSVFIFCKTRKQSRRLRIHNTWIASLEDAHDFLSDYRSQFETELPKALQDTSKNTSYGAENLPLMRSTIETATVKEHQNLLVLIPNCKNQKESSVYRGKSTGLVNGLSRSTLKGMATRYLNKQN